MPKKIYTAKKTSNKMKTSTMEGEKIFANYIPNKGLISNII
jgi:hypothetical protein